MAQINRRRNKNPFPFFGTFYTKGEPSIGSNGDMFQEDTDDSMRESVILETECDITETNRAFSAGAITASYDIYFPIKEGDTIDIERGQMFKANTKGISIIGMVVSISYSQMGGVHAYIKSSDF